MNTAVDQQSIAATMDKLGKAARAAAAGLALCDSEQRNAALRRAAAAIRAGTAAILAANSKDMHAAEARGISGAMLDRLVLDEERIESMACRMQTVRDFHYLILQTLMPGYGEQYGDWGMFLLSYLIVL